MPLPISFYSAGANLRPLRGISFQRKEGDTRMPPSPWCHFERKREIFFVRGQKNAVRRGITGNTALQNNWGSRCFMQTALRRKTKTGNEKDPSAALGMTKRGNASTHFFYSAGANLRPFGAPPSRGRREIRGCRPRTVPEPFGPDNPLS